MNKVILCADDYAQNDAISDGILQLLDKGVINATSCLTTAANWLTVGPTLLELRAKKVG